MDENLPKVYWIPKATDPKGSNKSGTIKDLSPSNQAELEALLRIGWTTEKPQEAK